MVELKERNWNRWAMVGIRDCAEEKLTRQLANIVHALKLEEVSAGIRKAASDRILDSIGVSLLSRLHPAVRVALDSLDALDGPCTLIGFPHKAGLADAAFVNAVCGHACLFEDLGGGGHPGCYIIPTVLAASERYKCSGAKALLAIIAGYEISERMDRLLSPGETKQRFRAVPTAGVFGAATSAGVVMALTADQLAGALDIAANMACGIYEPFREGAMEGYFHAGMSARSGIYAAQLSHAGAQTTRKSLDGENGYLATFGNGEVDLDMLLAPMSSRPAVMRARSKPFPACALNQDTMLLIRQLAPKGFAERDVEQVVLRRPAEGLNSFIAPGVSNSPPSENMLLAQMSARFTAAAALLGRPVEDISLYRDHYADEEINTLAAKIDLVHSEDGNILMKVKFRNGESVNLDSRDVVNLNWDTDRVQQKFIKINKSEIGASHTEKILETVTNIESLGSLRPLMDLLGSEGLSGP